MPSLTGKSILAKVGAFTTMNLEPRERLWSRVQAKAKPVEGIQAKRGMRWLNRG